MALRQFTFTSGSTEDIPLTADGVTDSMVSDTGQSALVFTSGWSLQVVSTGTDGSPTYTVEVLNAAGEWVNYSIDATDVPLSTIVKDDNFQFIDMRIRFKVNGNTAGTGKFTLTIK